MDNITYITQVDIYKLNKTELIQLLNQYGIKAPLRGDTCNRTLRPLASRIKSLVTVASSNDRLLKALLAILKDERDLTPDESKRYQNLEELQQYLKERRKLAEEGEVDAGLLSEENSEEEESKYENSHDYEKIIFKSSKPDSHTSVTLNLNPQIEDNTSEYLKPIMANPNLPLISAGNFSGLQTENPNEFIDRYLLASTANRWTPENELSLFPAHLTGTALAWFQNYKIRVPNFQWNDLKADFIKAFTPVALADNLNSIMERKIQGENETALNFLIDVITTCRRCKPNIPDTEIISFVLQGLKPQICRYVNTLKNNSLEELEENLRKAENYVLSTQRNQEKYEREQIRFNTRENSKDTVYRKVVSNDSVYGEELKNLKTLVANLELTVHKNRSRGKSPVPDRNRSKSGGSQNSWGEYRGKREDTARSRRERYEEEERYRNRDRDHSMGDCRRRVTNLQPIYKRDDYSKNYARGFDPRYSKSGTRPAVSFSEDRRSNNNYCRFCNTNTHMTYNCWFKPGYSRGGNGKFEYNRPHENYDNNKKIICYYCNKPSHISRDCRLRQADLARNQKNGGAGRGRH